MIGIALLIFGFGIYDLVISDLDPRYQGDWQQHTNLLSVSSLDSIKHALTNLFVLALIVSAFMTMIGFKVAISALGAWLIVRSRSDGMDTWQGLIRRK